jgi:hypothetical protein
MKEMRRKAIEFSNGTAPVNRANYPYAYKILREFSDTAITGIFGSEILRPIHNLGIMMNNYSEKIFLSGDYKKAIKASLDELKGRKYFKEHIFTDSCEYLIEEFKVRYFDKFKSYDDVIKLFFFLLDEGIRKYFMQELQIERVYITNRFPYFDDDLVDLMYKTPFAGMYNGFLGKSKIKRRRGQLLYAYILNKYMPELSVIELDRGYKPHDLLRMYPINYLYLLKGVIDTKKYLKEKGNDTFRSEKWSFPFMKSLFEKEYIYEDLFSVGFKNNFSNSKYLDEFLKYSHLISLNHYLMSIFK